MTKTTYIYTIGVDVYAFRLAFSIKMHCILHHLAFLFGRQLAIFSPPITHFQTLKTHFLRVILPFFAMYFMVRGGFIYTISVDIYAFRPAFSGK